jgi:hypothetical protein
MTFLGGYLLKAIKNEQLSDMQRPATAVTS